ncbi:hypothetical protein ACVWZA_000673 [Sphingomonas sp. UYAg733]
MVVDARVKDVGSIGTTPLFDMIVNLEEPVSFGDGPDGRRVLFASAGGVFEGARLRGEVLPGGGDWTLFRSTGVMTLDVRLSLRTDDGELVFMTYGGRFVRPADVQAALADPVDRLAVDPARYYFRTNPLFETGSSKYAWLNDVVCVGIGYLVDRGIAYKVFSVD